MDPNIKPHPVISRTPPGHGEDQLAALFGLCGQRRRKSSTAFFLTCSLPGHPESGQPLRRVTAFPAEAWPLCVAAPSLPAALSVGSAWRWVQPRERTCPGGAPVFSAPVIWTALAEKGWGLALASSSLGLQDQLSAELHVQSTVRF